MDGYIPPPQYLQNQALIGEIQSHTNNVLKLEFTVTDTAEIILPSNDNNRKKYLIFHDTEGEELLIDFQHEPTLTSYALALTAHKALIDSNWQGQIKGISRSGNPILVHVREYRKI